MRILFGPVSSSLYISHILYTITRLIIWASLNEHRLDLAQIRSLCQKHNWFIVPSILQRYNAIAPYSGAGWYISWCKNIYFNHVDYVIKFKWLLTESITVTHFRMHDRIQQYINMKIVVLSVKLFTFVKAANT